jgi:hypothetical protein
MSYLRRAREKRNKSPISAASESKVSRAVLQRLEAGQLLASPEQAELLRDYYRMPVLEARHFIEPSEVRRITSVAPFVVDPVNPVPWNVAWESWGRSMKLDLEVWEWMREFLPADSACECRGWCQCVVAGARPFLGNPHQWGFDSHALVDRQSRLLGPRVLPGLCYREGELDVAVWPQVCVRVDDRHCYRVDGLVFFRRGRQRYWLILEFDGDGHNFKSDAYRLTKIGLPEVRISGAEVREGRTFPLLLERAAQGLLAA